VQSILNDIGIRRNALYEFITALLPILRRKIDHILPQLLKNPPLFSHLMHENLVFDTTLRDEYLYLPFGQEKWEGTIQQSLKSQRVFSTWRDIEKDFAEGRYNDILSAKDASDLEYDAVDPQEVKPTKGAMRLMDLLESFTGRFL
jgi:RAD50-interacting protein 1